MMYLRSSSFILDRNLKCMSFVISCGKARNIILKKITVYSLYQVFVSSQQAGHRSEKCFRYTFGSITCHHSHSKNSVLPVVYPSRPFAHPALWFPQPSTLNRKIPWVCLGACWLSEVQWTAQIAWGVENSFVTGTLLSAKARWSFTVAALSMWNCFFSQET